MRSCEISSARASPAQTAAVHRPLCRGTYAPYVPCSPLTLAIAGSSANHVTLAWTDGSFNETGFRVERSQDGTGFAILATLPSGTTSYTDFSIAANTSYTYRVRALGAAGVSAPSAEVFVNPGGGTFFSWISPRDPDPIFGPFPRSQRADPSALQTTEETP